METGVSADFTKMKKEQYRSLIRFLFLKGNRAAKSKSARMLCKVTLLLRRSLATVKIWFNEFQRGRTSVFGEPRPGAPKMATTGDNVKKISDLVLADCRLKVREIAETVGTSKDCGGHILHEILSMRKLSA